MMLPLSNGRLSIATSRDEREKKDDVITSSKRFLSSHIGHSRRSKEIDRKKERKLQTKFVPFWTAFFSIKKCVFSVSLWMRAYSKIVQPIKLTTLNGGQREKVEKTTNDSLQCGTTRKLASANQMNASGTIKEAEKKLSLSIRPEQRKNHKKKMQKKKLRCDKRVIHVNLIFFSDKTAKGMTKHDEKYPPKELRKKRERKNKTWHDVSLVVDKICCIFGCFKSVLCFSASWWNKVKEKSE